MLLQLKIIMTMMPQHGNVDHSNNNNNNDDEDDIEGDCDMTIDPIRHQCNFDGDADVAE